MPKEPHTRAVWSVNEILIFHIVTALRVVVKRYSSRLCNGAITGSSLTLRLPTLVHMGIPVLSRVSSS